MPNQPKTPLRAFRIPDETYQPAKRYAEMQGTTMSDVVRDAIAAYVAAAPPRVTEHSCQHKAYRLSCGEYEALVDEADGRCQRCRKPVDNFRIDHDHRFGLAAVRGLVCPSCNTHLSKFDAGKLEALDGQTARYVASAWYLRKASR